MNNFAGWVRIDRMILEKTSTGKMTFTEYAVWNCLMLLADRCTGAGTINGPTLTAFLQGMKRSTAKRALTSLQKKHFIFCQITTHSSVVYPYWIQHYYVSDGIHKGARLELRKAFISKDIRDIQYLAGARDVPEGELERAPERELETAPEGAPEGDHYYKTEGDGEPEGKGEKEKEIKATDSQTVSNLKITDSTEHAALTASESKDVSFHSDSGQVDETPPSGQGKIDPVTQELVGESERASGLKGEPTDSAPAAPASPVRHSTIRMASSPEEARAWQAAYRREAVKPSPPATPAPPPTRTAPLSPPDPTSKSFVKPPPFQPKSDEEAELRLQYERAGIYIDKDGHFWDDETWEQVSPNAARLRNRNHRVKLQQAWKSTEALCLQQQQQQQQQLDEGLGLV